MIYELLIAVHHPEQEDTTAINLELEESQKESEKPDQIKQMQEKTT